MNTFCNDDFDLHWIKTGTRQLGATRVAHRARVEKHEVIVIGMYQRTRTSVEKAKPSVCYSSVLKSAVIDMLDNASDMDGRTVESVSLGADMEVDAGANAGNMTHLGTLGVTERMKKPSDP